MTHSALKHRVTHPANSRLFCSTGVTCVMQHAPDNADACRPLCVQVLLKEKSTRSLTSMFDSSSESPDATVVYCATTPCTVDGEVTTGASDGMRAECLGTNAMHGDAVLGGVGDVDSYA